MRAFPSSAQRVVPWKNGRGSTREVIVLPEGASIADFTVRLSVATVADDGPFSAFPGIDRWIAVLDGAGMDLDVDGARVPLDPGVGAAFSGDAAVIGTLRDGPVRDLNLMVRRGAVAVDPQLVTIEALVATSPTVVLVLDGALGPLGPGDAALLDPGERLLGVARAFVTTLEARP